MGKHTTLTTHEFSIQVAFRISMRWKVLVRGVEKIQWCNDIANIRTILPFWISEKKNIFPHYTISQRRRPPSRISSLFWAIFGPRIVSTLKLKISLFEEISIHHWIIHQTGPLLQIAHSLASFGTCTAVCKRVFSLKSQHKYFSTCYMNINLSACCFTKKSNVFCRVP